ncbi:short-chain fatty acyl-CoA regulator family protein [Novosphingobium bradum]|uniref:Short-chain fatty acyl-CoA regulator family protein n=1 Tax=Novosphingobium bradum TaxID=1737444 RepID=A0ABV7ITG9_9SPHN
MSQARPLYLGPRIRRLRRELGLTQQAMAADLDISPSYVALIERNQRPVTADLLLRLARTYRLDVSELAGEDSADDARRVGEVMRDPLLADIDLPALEIADLATSFPGVTEALLRLHGAYLREQQVLADRQLGREAHDPAAPDPVREAQGFFAAQRNHFPTLDAHAEELAIEIAEDGAAAEWLRKRKGVRVRYLPPEVLVESVRRFDRHNQQLLIDDTLDMPTRKFQVAVHIAWSTMREEITAIARAAGLSGRSAIALVRRNLAAYAAGALVMPYDRFARAAQARGHDVAALCGLFGASFEQVAHRLTTLGRPGQEGVPFFFLRVDPAGNVSKRLDGAGFPFAAQGGGCPLWSIHEAFRRPGEILTQWLELPDGQRFFSIARTVGGEARHVGAPGVMRAVALACAAEHAPRLAYARGIDPAGVPATPIGIGCRLCQRAACTARALPPIGRELAADDQRAGAAPYLFSEG